MENEFEAKEVIIDLFEKSTLNLDEVIATLKEVIEYYNLEGRIVKIFYDTSLPKLTINKRHPDLHESYYEYEFGKIKVTGEDHIVCMRKLIAAIELDNHLNSK